MRLGWNIDKPPSYDEEYLVQLDGGGMCVCRWTDTNPIWTNLKTDWHWCKFDLPQYSEVIAWHLLPKPYGLEGKKNE